MQIPQIDGVSTKIRALLKADAQGAIGWASLGEPHQYSVTIR
jgi:hypothetical protein